MSDCQTCVADELHIPQRSAAVSAMAAPAASSMAHHLPPMSIPAMPRIRPPRLLKGDPHPNNAPPPLISSDGPASSKWVQGKWRTSNSRAVKNKRATQDIQVAKALRHQNHGLDIYAYRHIRTNQVVYSLTRTLQVQTHRSRVGTCANIC